MNCRCLRATEVELRRGVYTITVEDGIEFDKCGDWEILLASAIPTDTACNTVEITNDSGTFQVLNRDGDYYRTTLKCRTILVLRFFDDPEHFNICGVKR